MPRIAEKAWASPLAEAKRNAHVNMISSSGTKWTVRPLTLDELMAEDGLPDDLLKVAVLEASPGGAAIEMAARIASGEAEALDDVRKLASDLVSLRDRIVLRACLAPKLKQADLAQLDPYDLAEIAAVAQHRLAVDKDGRLIDAMSFFRSDGGD